MSHEQGLIKPKMSKKSPMVLCDVLGNCWKLGKLLGEGGEGRVYSACSPSHPTVDVAVKVFATKKSFEVEKYVYQTIFSSALLAEHKRESGFAHVAAARIFGYGKHVYKDARGDTHKFNYIVMQKLKPLGELRTSETALLCVQILDILAHIHSKGWTHNDIRSDNIMVDNAGNFYLIDYGLATTYSEIPFSHSPTPVDLPYDIVDSLGSVERYRLILEVDYLLAHTQSRVRSPIYDEEDVIEEPEGAKSALHVVIPNRAPIYHDLCHPFSLAGLSGRGWKSSGFVGGCENKIYSVVPDDETKYVVKLGADLTKEITLYTNIYTEKQSHLPYYIDSGLTPTGLHFLITPKYRQPIEKECLKDISTSLFIRMVKDVVAGLEYLHKFGYCHNRVCPDSVFFDIGCGHFVLSDVRSTTIQRSTPDDEYTPSTTGSKLYTGLDSHTPGMGPSPRSDIDSLVFSMMVWAGLRIPWAKLTPAGLIEEEKLKFMENPHMHIAKCASKPKRTIIEEIIKLNKTTPFSELPDYDSINDLCDWAATEKYPCHSSCHCPELVACPCCRALYKVKDAFILGLPDENCKTAIHALKYTNLW